MACQQLAVAVTALPAPSCPSPSHTLDHILLLLSCFPARSAPGLVSRVVSQTLVAAQLRGRCSHVIDGAGCLSVLPLLQVVQLKRPQQYYVPASPCPGTVSTVGTLQAGAGAGEDRSHARGVGEVGQTFGHELCHTTHQQRTCHSLNPVCQVSKADCGLQQLLLTNSCHRIVYNWIIFRGPVSLTSAGCKNNMLKNKYEL